ncbi:NUDIX hydrolase [Salinibacillus xinjiangensis]|uniref:NUDIX domain-containing protein n=1 Tax=Salinibacillus xinjiangensis TaxID=1229268 RepID=A0A6G1X4P4_9BACI|nr:NUDIX hydrolase [Salinibacillus xinjiangensis]MRG85917.1 NUDIX domain-containing protein [Salinibacillus xinjiangensis]
MSYKWLEWAKRIQAISQAGLTFSKDVYDIERYEELRHISAEIMEEYSEMDFQKVDELFSVETGYPTPKMDVRGAVFQNNQVLLVKEMNEDLWSLPGGFCEIGLSPGENIVKEIKEESGFEVTPVKLLAALDKNKHPHPPDATDYYKLFIQCEIHGGEARVGVETSEVRFFSESNLPKLSVKRNTESQVNMLFEFLQDPGKEPVFD